ncbi:MAG: Cache 3/Cache 2 fusion domain-containing protein [Bacteroidota bacterium]|nr:Cache 3/Cache 2 fusion domain-containing protein [Bacteroidota bacterium]
MQLKISSYLSIVKLKLPPKLQLFIPIFAGIIISIVAITIISINIARNTLYDSIEENLKLEVHNLMKMFEREYAMKLEKVKTDLRVTSDYFYIQELKIKNKKLSISAANQINGKQHEVEVDQWLRDGAQLQGNFEFVDKMQELFGGTITIFQKIDSGLLRISTNVLNNDGSRAIGTYIPNGSPVVQTIEKGETYIGRAFVVNDWYITAYEPVIKAGKVIGALYVGGKEKDLDELKEIVMGTTIGISGFPYVFDDDAVFVIHPVSEGEDWSHLDFMQEIMEMKTGTLRYYSPTTEGRRLTAFNYFEDFHFYVAATIDPVLEAQPLISKIIRNSVLVGLIILLALSAFVYFVTSEKIHRFLNAIESSNKKLSSAREALKRSEKLAELGQLSSAIFKEINKPLSNIFEKAKSLQENFDKDSSVYQNLQEISSQARKGKNTLSGILNFSSDTRMTLKETNINEMLDICAREMIVPGNVRLLVEKDPRDPSLYLDTSKMIQAIKNILKNSIESLSAKGNVKLKAESGNRQLVISIEDDGPGIDQAEFERLFDPFYQSDRQEGKGAGLGLAVSYGIIKMHQGEINIRSNTDPAAGPTGTTIRISLNRN